MSILLRRFHNSGSVIETVVEYTAPERVVVKNNISGDGIDLYDDSKSTYDYDTQTGKLVYNGKLKVLAELDNTKLTSITIPECVEVVYAKCFDKCSQLRTVNFLHKKDGGNISFDLSIDYFSFAFSNITDIYINGVFSQDWINSIGNGFLQGVPKYMLSENGKLLGSPYDRTVTVHCSDRNLEYECVSFNRSGYERGDYYCSEWQIKK